MNNDEKAREILESEQIPEELSPENMKKMLDEKSDVPERKSRISVTGRIIAAAAAFAVIIGGGAGTLMLAERENRMSRVPGNIEENGKTGSTEATEATEYRVEKVQAKGPYMKGAESYEQIYRMFEEAENNRIRTKDYAIEGAVAEEDALFDSGIAAPGVSVPKGEQNINSGAAESFPQEEYHFTDEASDDTYEEPAFEENEGVYDNGEDDISCSDTYMQEKDVLEADIVKTDGRKIYHLSSFYDNDKNTMVNWLDTAGVEDGIFSDVSRIEAAPEINVEGEGWNITSLAEDMYLYNDMIIITGSVSAYRDYYSIDSDYESDVKGVYDDYYSWDEKNQTYVMFYSKEDEPRLLGTYYQDGYYNDVRIAPDGYMYLISNYWSYGFDDCEDSSQIEKYIPQCGLENMEFIAPEDILLPDEYLDNFCDMSYTVIGSIDLTAPMEFEVCDTKALAGYTGEIYCSAENLYTASGYENTDITRLSVSGGRVTPEASGTVEGYVKDQFSMSEYEGCLRVATTVDKWVWDDNDSLTGRIRDTVGEIFGFAETDTVSPSSEHINHNNVYVLDMDMNVLGSVENFGENESVKSVNFSGNMGYVVTYQQTDPLFAIDLSDPENPFITDEFKILGYSTYMQKWDDGLLLGFGADADENGRETGVKLVMFDNSDPYNLKETGLYSINRSDDENSYIYSSALYERKAILAAPEKNIIGIPVVEEYFDEYDMRETEKYMFFSYDNGEFTLKGELSETVNMWDKYGYNVFERALYIGDYVYVVSDNEFVSADMETITETDRAVFQ